MPRWAEWHDAKPMRWQDEDTTPLAARLWRYVGNYFWFLVLCGGPFLVFPLIPAEWVLAIISSGVAVWTYFDLTRWMEERRSRSADESALIGTDESLAAIIELHHAGFRYGKDEGVLTLEKGLLCFTGRRTSFSLHPDEVRWEGQRLYFPGPQGEYDFRIEGVRFSPDLWLHHWKSRRDLTSDGAMVLPPVKPLHPFRFDVPLRLASLGLVLFGSCFLVTHVVISAVLGWAGILLFLAGLIGGFHVWRGRMKMG